MIWSPSRRLLFIHIPKTGGTSIELAYQPHILFGDIILGAWRLGLDPIYGKHLHIGKHSPAVRVARLLGAETFRDFYSFAVVRDPVDRMVSYFKWIHSYPHNGAYEVAMKKITDFATFVEAASPRFSPQGDLVNDPNTGEVMVTQLIPFSRLSDGWAYVCGRYGLEPSLPRTNISKDVEVEVTESGRALACELYADDVQLLEAAEVSFAACCPLPAEDAPEGREVSIAP